MPIGIGVAAVEKHVHAGHHRGASSMLVLPDRPVPAEQQLFDPVSVQEIVQRDVPEHHEHRVVAVLGMLRRSRPLLRRERAKARHEAAAVVGKALQRVV
jgi:hypothetical protein